MPSDDRTWWERLRGKRLYDIQIPNPNEKPSGFGWNALKGVTEVAEKKAALLKQMSGK